jgi:hypothetical protein
MSVSSRYLDRLYHLYRLHHLYRNEAGPVDPVSNCIRNVTNLIKPVQKGRNPTLANVKRRVRRKDGGVAQRIGQCFEQVLQLVNDRLSTETGFEGLVNLELVLEHMEEGRNLISKSKLTKENRALVKTLLKTHAEGGTKEKAVIRGGMAFTGEVTAERVASLLQCHRSSVYRSRGHLTRGHLHTPSVPGVRWTVPPTEHVISHIILSIYLSIYLSICLSIYPYIHVSDR